MTATSTPEESVRRAPRWLQLLAGLVLFPIPWLGIVFAGDAVLPLPALWLLIAALPAAALAWIIVRRASSRLLVPLIPTVLLCYIVPIIALTSIISRMAPMPADTGAAPPPSYPPPVEARVEPPAPPASQPDGAGGGARPESPAQAAEETRRRAEAEARRAEAEEEARRRADEEAARRAEAEALRKRAEEAQQKAGEEARRRAAEAAARKAAEAEQGRREQPVVGSKSAPRPTSPPQGPPGGIAQFPWPPPQSSASYVLPSALFEGHTSTGQVTTSIITALERRGYVERSFFRTPSEGVALVTRLERINEDGSPAADTERWPAGLQDATRTAASLGQFLRGLFYVDPGRYRVIVFVIQDAPFSQSSERITGDQARSWLRQGANVLPRNLAERPFTGNCTALVYEFTSDGSAVRVVESRLTGRQHLERAGVLAVLTGAN